MDDQSEVFAFLSNPATHGLKEPVQRIDTHAACVFLAGADAYKVKRAVRFPFLDFTTLDARRKACENELVVNRENAPGLYLGVVPITRGPDGLSLSGLGEVVEWAVHLRRFDEAQTLDRVAEAEGLPDTLIAKLATRILKSHGRALVRTDAGAQEAFEAQARDTLDELDDAADSLPAASLRALRGAAEAALERLRPVLRQRGAQGRVRRCHGDLHLRNVVLLEGEPVLFDAIEFNDAIATCDVLYDLAFMLMDLWHRGFPAKANLLLNRYLWGSEAEALDLEGLAALPLFLSLRASIRAKVACDLARVSHGNASAVAEAEAYLNFALELLADRRAPRLIAIGGLSGTGKSTLAARLAPRVGGPPGAVHMRSDIERKRLYGCAEQERLPPAAYTPAVTAETYARVREMARLALRSGTSVVVDAVHARPEERTATAAVARDCGAIFQGLWLEAPAGMLRGRVAARTHDASDATVEVVDFQAGLETGPILWPCLDAARPLDETVQAALGMIEGEADQAIRT